MRRDAILLATVGALALAGLGALAGFAAGQAGDLAGTLERALAPWVAATRAGLFQGAVVFVAAAGASLAVGAADCVRVVHGAVFAAGALLAVALAALTGGGTLAVPPVLVNGGAALAAALIAAGLLGHAGARTRAGGRVWSRLGFAVAFFAAPAVGLPWALGMLEVPGDPAAVLPSGISGEALALAAALSVAVVLRLVAGTPMGLAVRAATEDRDLLAADGHRVGRVGTAAILGGVALAAAGFALWFLTLPGTGATPTPTTATLHVVLVAAAMVAGGVGSLRGSLLAALLIAMTGAYAEAVVPGAQPVGQVGAFILLLALRPRGVMPVPRLAA